MGVAEAIDLPITPGWRAVHIGFANDGARVAGAGLWDAPWRPLSEPALRLPHPAHPHQRHRFDAYETGDPPVRFAAAEVSNGVWAFYIPQASVTLERREIAGGALIVERRIGEQISPGRYDSLYASAVLIDAASLAVLADCGAWPSSVIDACDDGCLLRLSTGTFDTAFRVDMPTRSFRDIVEDASAHPLAELDDAVERARWATGRPRTAPAARRIAPGGGIWIDLEAVEWSNSHWVYAPRVIANDDGRIVFDLWGSDWDAAVSFVDGAIRLALRGYRSGAAFGVTIDADAERYVADGADGWIAERGTLAALRAALLAITERPSRGAPLPGTTRGDRWAAWPKALVILAGALAAIGLVAVIAARRPAPVQRLDTIPPMPGVAR